MTFYGRAQKVQNKQYAITQILKSSSNQGNIFCFFVHFQKLK